MLCNKCHCFVSPGVCPYSFPIGCLNHKTNRVFDTGADRDTDQGKLDYEGFLSPLVLRRFAQYMESHQHRPDGSIRTSDNWQAGMPIDVYLKSAIRHLVDLWLQHRGHDGSDSIEDALCGILFNIQGYLHEYLKLPSTGDE